MAKRPIFLVKDGFPYVEELEVQFAWHPGFAQIQKQKNIDALHKSAKQANPQTGKILEISTKSPDLLGQNLSAFNLLIDFKTSRSVSVESVFQSSKVFHNGGPYKDLLNRSSYDAKKDPRLKGRLKEFRFKGEKWPLQPVTLFYDWIYLNALQQERNSELSSELTGYDAFTDIEFNPYRKERPMKNCQARSAALYVGLYHSGDLRKALKSRASYESMFSFPYNKYAVTRNQEKQQKLGFLNEGETEKIVTERDWIQVIRMLQSVGVTTFIDCFAQRQEIQRCLSIEEVHQICLPTSNNWRNSSLKTKTSQLNRIFRLEKQLDALDYVCNKVKKISQEKRLKAMRLKESYGLPDVGKARRRHEITK